MQEKLIDFILWVNKKFFFKRKHPFNVRKNWILNLNYSEFEYEKWKDLLKMYSEIIDINFYNKKILEVWCWWWWKSVYIAEKYIKRNTFSEGETNKKSPPNPPLEGGIEVVGIDIDDNFLSQARQFARQKKVDNIVHFYKKSALNTDFQSRQFDIIIMSDVLEHIPETEKLLEEMWRILKKDWIILFDFAPYYHYFGHHLWDTIQIPWIHLFFSDKFLIKLYKKSTKNLEDSKERIKLRIWKDNNWKEVFDYLNKIKRKDFEKIIKIFTKKHKNTKIEIRYYMLKNLNFLWKIPFLRELLLKHIVWYINK